MEGSKDSLTIEEVAEISRLFKQGWNFKEVSDYLKWPHNYHKLRNAVRLHGYVITKKLVESTAKPRIWNGKKKLTIEQLKQIDEWMSKEELSTDHIVRLVRIRMNANVITVSDFNDLLFRSGFSWRYAIMLSETEEDELLE